MHLVNDPVGVGVRSGVLHDGTGEASAGNPLDGRVEACSAFGMIEPGVVPGENGVGIDLQHRVKTGAAAMMPAA
jgi:hypothetical protein